MKTWYIVIILAIIALGLWYFYGMRASSNSPQSAPLTAGNTTADISSDLGQTPDSAALNADANASAAAVQGL